MITVFSTKDTPCHTLQRIMDDAVTQKWREETYQPSVGRGDRLAGATIHEICKHEEQDNV